MRKNTFSSKHDKCFKLPLLLTAFILLVCSSCSDDDKLDFKSPEDALMAYQEYLNSIKVVTKSNTNEFCKELNNWKEIADTVYHYLMKDSTFIKNIHCANYYASIHDSVRFELIRLTETWRFSYEDVLKIKEQSSVFHDDQELHQAVNDAAPFFLALDSIQIEEESKSNILSRYRAFLKEVKSKGIHNKAAMLDYIAKEDILFRSFLSRLYEMDNEPLSDITMDTETICREIFIAAKNGKIPAREAVIYMSMRTVRRLLQNSTVCITDINKQQMKSKEQGNAYLWMIIQPFISIDQLSIVMLTPNDHGHFSYIMSQLPKSVKFARTFNIDQRALNYLLPQQLLKMYLLTL